MKKKTVKAFQIRLDKEVWMFLKLLSARQERSMNLIIEECVNKYKKRFDKVLTGSDTTV